MTTTGVEAEKRADIVLPQGKANWKKGAFSWILGEVKGEVTNAGRW